MKILILTNLDMGLYKFRKELIEEFLLGKHEVILALPQGDYIEPLTKLGCSVIEAPVDRRGINPFKDFMLYLKYRKIMKQVDPDLVITYTIKPNIYGGMAARSAGKNYAVNVTGLGTAFEKPGILRSLVIALYRYALKEVKAVFVENSGIKDALGRYGLCNIDKVIVLNGAGVNTDRFPYQEYPHNDRMHFLFIGRIMKEKGIEEVLSAMKRLIDEGMSCILDVVGPYEEKKYEEIFGQCESEGWLKYHGYQDDVTPYIAACDCFVLPSYHEGMANTNLECASSGRPVITSAIPGCRESVIEGETGFLCEPQNVDSVYEAMRKILCCTESERTDMGRKGRQHMQEVFEKKLIVARTLQGLFQ